MQHGHRNGPTLESPPAAARQQCLDPRGRATRTATKSEEAGPGFCSFAPVGQFVSPVRGLASEVSAAT